VTPVSIRGSGRKLRHSRERVVASNPPSAGPPALPDAEFPTGRIIPDRTLTRIYRSPSNPFGLPFQPADPHHMGRRNGAGPKEELWIFMKRSGKTPRKIAVPDRCRGTGGCDSAPAHGWWFTPTHTQTGGKFHQPTRRWKTRRKTLNFCAFKAQGT